MSVFYTSPVSVSGGTSLPSWQDPDWVDIGALYDADTSSGYTYRTYCLINASDLSTTLPAGFAYLTSDGDTYVNGGTHTWDTAQDLYDSFATPYRWIAYYTDSAISGVIGTTPNFNNSVIWVVDGIPRTTALQGATLQNNSYNYSYCYALKHITFKIDLTNGLTSNTFRNSYNLYSVQYNSITDASVSTYQSCFSLTYDTQLNGVSSNGYANCFSLKYLKLNSSTIADNSMLSGAGNLQWLELPVDWNFNGLNISYSINYSTEALVDIISKLKDRSADTTYTFIMGATNLAKLTAGQIAVATAKNWTLS